MKSVVESKAWFIPRRRVHALLAALYAIVLIASMAMVGHSDLDEAVASVGRTFEYRLRIWVGRAPKLDPKLRVFSIDDETVEAMGSPHLSQRQWRDALKSIALFKPQIVMVDGDIRFLSSDSDSADEGRRLPKALVVVGSVLHSSVQFSSKYLVTTERPEFFVKRLAAKNIRELPGSTIEKGYLLGPNKDVLPIFDRLGHRNLESLGRFKPIISTNEAVSIQHFGLFAQASMKAGHGSLWSGKKRVPVNGTGRMLINYVDQAEVTRRMRPLNHLFIEAQSDRNERFVKPGDVIYIATNAFSGHQDYQDTPVGLQSGFLSHLAIANSALRNEWLSEIPLSRWMVFVLISAGFALAIYCRGMRFFVGFAVAQTLIILLGFGSFLFANLALPWFGCSILLSLSALPSFALLYHVRLRSAFGIKGAFEGLITQEQLDLFVEDPGSIALEPTEKIVTVMFIDIAGFSNSVDVKSPHRMFEDLQVMLNEMKRIIQSYDGTIVGALGDTILCFFGYGYDGKKREQHVAKGLACAIRLQQEALTRLNARRTDEDLSFPLRIGLNTASVYFGDLGGDFNTNMTMIGEGVNFTRRLQTSCEPYRIMIGPSAFDALRSSGQLSINLIRRMLHDQKYDKLVEAYEYDPASDLPDLVRKARPVVMQIRRRSERYLVPETTQVDIISKIGSGYIRDFSTGGLAVELENYLSNAIHINVWLGREGSDLREKATEAGLNPLLCEVRWGRPRGKRYFHGLEMKFLNEDQRQKLVAVIRESF